ncbi:thioredoxin domain-containing protein [Chloropicon primus]|uniref:Thioredoxin domain-containing protein n=1 Tax=Chloropicon primus TaxID=1764295 RepID=A0A5B8MF90_9CHLO|nr:hypothetical protein A3770_02p16170 [Chloropicon primus]UPQ98308.1 thioredoxin domain-containing protein [Chloropicon primus]|eukprot:QDZ19099.1 hypothetical protein A3770_02p16170 [Chloropicon primus]
MRGLMRARCRHAAVGCSYHSARASVPFAGREARSSRRLSGRRRNGAKLSDSDYHVQVVLGIEVRESSVKAALVSSTTGEFVRPGVRRSIEGDAGMDDVLLAVKGVVRAFGWNGPAGVSITRAVARLLGSHEVERVLSGALPCLEDNVAVMIHTEAAAYAEMLCGAGASSKSGKVLILTVGKNLGAVVYEDGQKVRGFDVSHLTWQWELELTELQKRFSFSEISPPPPENGSEPGEGWVSWTESLGKMVGKISQHAGDPGQVIIMPTGSVVNATMPKAAFLRHMREELPQRVEVLVGSRPEGAMIRGAAIGANAILLGRELERKEEDDLQVVMSAMELESFLSRGGDSVVFVSGKGCAKCRREEGKIARRREDFEGVRFVKLDVDSNRSTLQWTRDAGIRRVPHYLLYKNGELVDRANDLDDLRGLRDAGSGVEVECS